MKFLKHKLLIFALFMVVISVSGFLIFKYLNNNTQPYFKRLDDKLIILSGTKVLFFDTESKRFYEEIVDTNTTHESLVGGRAIEIAPNGNIYVTTDNQTKNYFGHPPALRVINAKNLKVKDVISLGHSPDFLAIDKNNIAYAIYGTSRGMLVDLNKNKIIKKIDISGDAVQDTYVKDGYFYVSFVDVKERTEEGRVFDTYKIDSEGNYTKIFPDNFSRFPADIQYIEGDLAYFTVSGTYQEGKIPAFTYDRETNKKYFVEYNVKMQKIERIMEFNIKGSPLDFQVIGDKVYVLVMDMNKVQSVDGNYLVMLDRKNWKQEAVIDLKDKSNQKDMEIIGNEIYFTNYNNKSIDVLNFETKKMDSYLLPGNNVPSKIIYGGKWGK